MLSETICALRRRAGLSQEQLAERLGVSRQAVSKWENGSAVPGLDKLQALCQCFQVTMDQLTGEAPPEGLPGGLPPAPAGPSRRERWGAVLCALGGLCLVLTGALLVLRPDMLSAVNESSTVTLNGSGLLLLLCLLLMGAGAALVLGERERRH